MGATHIRAIEGLPDVELAAVSSSDPRKLAGDLSGAAGNLGSTFTQFDFCQAAKYARWQDLLTDPTLDAVDLCLPTALHAEAAAMALAAGKHVLVEKPLALDGASADALIAQAKAAGRVLMAAQVLRFFPMYRQMIDLVRLGSLGAIRSASFRRRCAAPGWAAWMKDKSQSGGGVFDLLIHDVDMALLLCGRPDAVSATGYEDLAAGTDTIQANLQCAGIPSVTIAGGWHPGAFPFSMEYTIVCEGGVVDYHSGFGDPKLYRAGAAESETLVSPEGVDGYREEIRYFADACTGKQDLALCPPEDSAAAVRIALAMAGARQFQGEKVPCLN